MNNNSIEIETECFKNESSPFTELFSLLKRFETLPEGSVTMAYKTHELKEMHQHIDNAVDVLLQGLQGVGHLIGIALSNKKMTEEINNLGFFISSIANLTEALNALRSDSDYVLKERGMHY